MSKNFEEEYKALANEELPDLWNRIENGLTPKTTALSEESMEMQPAEKEGDAGHGKEHTKKQKGKEVLSFLCKYRTVAAAALCVAVVIPAVIVLGKMGKVKNWEALDESTEINMAAAQSQEGLAAEEAMDDCAVEESAEEAAGEEIADTTMKDAVAEDIAAESGSASGGVMQNGMDSGAESSSAGSGQRDMGDLAETDRASALPIDELTNEEKKSDKNQQTADFMAEAQKQEGTVKIYENVTIEVTEITEETIEAGKNIFYGMKVKVVTDPAGELEEGKEITVWVSYFSSMAYLKGEIYTLKLSYDPDRECPYQVS